MRKPAALLAACLALGTVVLPAPALAGGRFHAPSPSHGGFRPAGGAHAGHGLVGDRVHHARFGPAPPGHFSGRFHQRPRHPRFRHHHLPVTWVPSVILYAPPIADTPPPVVSPSVVVNASPVVYASPTFVYPGPAPVAAAPPAAPPMPTVVEYPTGRYELRGDGVTSPHVWVWVPNPPPAPPAAPPDPEERSPGPGAPATPSRIYRWTDEQGTTFVTNRLDKVPAPYRSRAQRQGSRGDDPS